MRQIGICSQLLAWDFMGLMSLFFFARPGKRMISMIKCAFIPFPSPFISLVPYSSRFPWRMKIHLSSIVSTNASFASKHHSFEYQLLFEHCYGMSYLSLPLPYDLLLFAAEYWEGIDRCPYVAFRSIQAQKINFKQESRFAMSPESVHSLRFRWLELKHSIYWPSCHGFDPALMKLTFLSAKCRAFCSKGDWTAFSRNSRKKWTH